MTDRVNESDTDDSDLTLYQLHCRYAILGGLDMGVAAHLWRTMKAQGLSREEHMAALLDDLPETAPTVEVPGLAIEESAVEGRKMLEGSTRHARNPALTACRLELDGFECQRCHFKVPQMLSASDGPAPLRHHVVEVHHITPIRAGERRTRLTDLVTLCPTCHRLLHAVASALGRDDLPVSLLDACGIQAEHVRVEHDSDIA